MATEGLLVSIDPLNRRTGILYAQYLELESHHNLCQTHGRTFILVSLGGFEGREIHL